ncbi:universal stress protein [Saccharothrix algeriensis]|uniref:Nucleotide-binding universal stress UspA family protein n=1 Tax=Saccharothrix algeriensis TaxID=173560 RepID=A0A8T8HZZ7_9PSEU|nr:universal stress protein [Saccharothrix algeriensis]MBM7809678.1 nucleotide-binding universal stress UspA family protein [Saccharothrix algeriensis]QTR03977.1 universal stress protein [Saccharothrix algeriensis]
MSVAPIVVGVDGTPAGERALRWAVDEAVRWDAPLHVVNAYQYEPLADWTEEVEERIRAESLEVIDGALDAVCAGRPRLPSISRLCVRGPAAEVLEASARGAVMLVVAAHGGSRLRRIVLGSTSAHCVRHATSPVVVLPAAEEPTTR